MYSNKGSRVYAIFVVSGFDVCPVYICLKMIKGFKGTTLQGLYMRGMILLPIPGPWIPFSVALANSA